MLDPIGARVEIVEGANDAGKAGDGESKGCQRLLLGSLANLRADVGQEFAELFPALSARRESAVTG